MANACRSLKRMGRGRIGSTLALSWLVTLGAAPPTYGYKTGVAGYSGQYGETCESHCHTGGVTPTVSLAGPATVAPGAIATFRFTVHSQSPTQIVAGLDVSASAGMLGLAGTAGTQILVGEVTHTHPQQAVDGDATWELTWTAPSVTGPQTLYAAGLSANGNDNRDGDAMATTRYVVMVGMEAYRGDANCDGVVSAADLTAVWVHAAAGAHAGRARACALADVDCNGEVDESDVEETTHALFASLESACGVEPTPSPTSPASQTLTPGSTTPTATPTPTPSLPVAATPTPSGGASATPASTTPASTTPGASPTPGPPSEWTTLGHDQRRLYFNDQETRITRDNVSTMRFKWRYLTGAIVTASPSVAFVDVPGEGRIKIVFVASWDGNLYALRASNGSQLWRYTMKPHPGGSYPYASSAEIATVDGEARVFVGGGMTVYSLAAASGALRWEFDAGTGCTTCDLRTERNEIESSPTVVGDLVYFGMDVNDSGSGKGGAYALSAHDGRLVWYFDLETQATCRPLPTDNIRRFDGYHTAAALRVPDDFFATRPGCDFSRAGTACGNIWSSFAVDPVRRLIYTASSNCDTDTDPTTPSPPPPMPAYDEALFALSYEGAPVWVWRPREVDNGDLAFGAVPNLFAVDIGGATREVVGIGNKDGTYYLLDRDGTNAVSGRIEPYWQTNVVPGGAIGGIIASPAVGDGSVFFSTGFGVSISSPQRPAAWSLRATDGVVRWSNRTAPPSYGPTTAIHGVAFMGGIGFAIVAYDADNGTKLHTFPLDGPVASGAAIVDGEVFVGAGTGARDGRADDQGYQASLIPSYVSALCLPDAGDCPATLCDDGNVCTYDFGSGGGCRSEPAPDGITCRVGGQPGSCTAGTCRLP